MKQLCLFVFALPVLLVPVACRRGDSLPQTSTPQQQVIQTVVVHRQPAATELVLPARIAANPTEMVHVYPLLSGRVLSLRILPGQQVRKGETIGTMQSSDAAQARSDFEKAKIEAARADLQLARAKELLAHDVMAQRDYDDLVALDESDHSELDRARQALHVLGFNENSTSDTVPILAPISGVVLDVGTGPGELQRSLDNATPIATIADIRLHLGRRRSLSPRPGSGSRRPAGGHYGQRLSRRHAARRGRQHLRRRRSRHFHAQGSRRASQSRRSPQARHVREHDRQQGSARRHRRSLHGRDSKRQSVFVFVETSPGKYARRDVTLGGTHADNDEITQGLHDGDKVVITGAELLRESEDH